MYRPAYLAGTWYPDSERACRDAIEAHAADASSKQGLYRGLIGPHAGWRYSGDAAGAVYAALASSAPDPQLVVVFGSHLGPRSAHTVFLDEGWDSPLGPTRTPIDLAKRLSQMLDLAPEPTQPQRPDNAVEVHIPFIRHFFPTADVLMVGVAPHESAEHVGRTIGELVIDERIDAVFVGSTDLTHYGPNYGFEPQGTGAVAWVRDENDRGFIDAILKTNSTEILQHARENQSACCPGAVVACLEAVRIVNEPSVELVSHYLSCDVMPSDSFVGYAGLLL